jgi:hypothetical protein
MVARIPRIQALVVCASVVGLLAVGARFFSPNYLALPIARHVSAAQTRASTLPVTEHRATVGHANVASSPRTGSLRIVRLRLLSIPLDLYAMAWFLLTCVVAFGGRSYEDVARSNLYIYMASIVGMAGMLWAFYQVSFRFRMVAPEYQVAAVMVCVVFTLASIAGHAPIRRVLRRAPSDLWREMRECA